MIPDYVQQYWMARWWEFLHIGIPAMIAVGIVWFIAIFKLHREDMHVNDETDEKPGKILGL